MLGITLIAVGKIKEKFYSAAMDEYLKRLSAYCRFEVIEVKDEKTPENMSEIELEGILSREAERIEAKIPKNATVISLCVEGKQLASEEFAEMVSDFALEGNSRLCFVIGGSVGLSDRIKGISKFRLSFSKMTFPHMLMRVVFAEQLYRAFTIIEGKPYHK